MIITIDFLFFISKDFVAVVVDVRFVSHTSAIRLVPFYFSLSFSELKMNL